MGPTSRVMFRNCVDRHVVLWQCHRRKCRLVRNVTHLVSKDHESVVSLASDGSAHTLSSVTHGIKRQEVILSDLKLIPKVLQTSLKHASQHGRNIVSYEPGLYRIASFIKFTFKF